MNAIVILAWLPFVALAVIVILAVREHRQESREFRRVMRERAFTSPGTDR